MDIRKIRNSLLLFLAAFIWGIAFVAQSKGMDYIGPFTFNFYRNLIASFVLIPVIMLSDKSKGKKFTFKSLVDKKLVMTGFVCGFFLCSATMFQQFGLSMGTESGKAGFITSLYIIFVPILCMFLGKKTPLIVWLSLPVALIGLYLLCVNSTYTIRVSDILVFICAILFACQIISIDRLGLSLDSVRIAWFQFVVSTILCAVPTFVLERNSLSQVMECIIPILYTGIFSSGVAYTLQVVGQKNVNPTIASLIMSFESVFSVLAGWIILKDRLGVKEIIGCVLVFISIIAVQLIPDKKPQ